MEKKLTENKYCLDIEKLNPDKELIPLLENINTFMLLEEYSRADDLANKIINEKPTSPVGWFAKAVVVSNNFKAKSLCDKSFIDKYKIYEKNILNAIKISSEKAKEYISEKHNNYEKECIEFTEGGIIHSLSLLFDDAIENRRTSKEVCYILAMAYDKDDMRERISFALTKDQNNLYFGLYSALLHVNRINYKNYESGYDSSTSETIEEALGLMFVNPRQSTSDTEDIYISVIIQLCSFLNINSDNIHKYYTEEKRKEYEEEKRIEEEKRDAEEKRKLEELIEEDRKHRKELKKNKIKNLIKRTVLVAFLLCVAVLLAICLVELSRSSPRAVIAEPITEFVDQTDDGNHCYYVMADNCNAINVRTGPGKNYDVVTVIRDRSIKLHPTGMTDGDWIAISTEEFGEAWVNKDVVKMVEE